MSSPSQVPQLDLAPIGDSLKSETHGPRVPGHPRVLGFSRSPASLGSAPFPSLSGGASLLVLQPPC